MKNIIITIGNDYFPNITEDFYHPFVDITDLEELDYIIDECCGIYLDLHGDLIRALTPDCTREEIEEACFYLIEEVPNESN